MTMKKNNKFKYLDVPVPEVLLEAYCRWLADALATLTKEQERVDVTISDTQKKSSNVIGLSIKAALEIGGDIHPFALADLHSTYLRANPGIGKGTTRASFDATANYHCINMRARFPDPRHKEKTAPWLTRPVFKRVARSRYMLLSKEEIALFRQRVEEGDPRVFQDAYDVDDLA
jgi:hypothetical protein